LVEFLKTRVMLVSQEIQADRLLIRSKKGKLSQFKAGKINCLVALARDIGVFDSANPSFFVVVSRELDEGGGTRDRVFLDELVGTGPGPFPRLLSEGHLRL
jgi:hypothetical protein